MIESQAGQKQLQLPIYHGPGGSDTDKYLTWEQTKKNWYTVQSMYYMYSNLVQKLPYIYIMTKEILLPEKRQLNYADTTYFLDGPDTSGV